MNAERWPYFPLFLRLSGQRVLLVGGGEVALRKARLLRRAGARIEVVANSLHSELSGTDIRHIGSEFDPTQLTGCRLVIAATDDAAVNSQVAAAARAGGVLVNVVDNAADSDWITPSIVDRSPLLVAISSGGGAPVLARRVREQLEAQLPAALGRLARFLEGARQRLKGLEVGLRRRAV